MVLTVTFRFVQWGVNSSAGRVQKNGTTYALATSGKPPYTEKSWTTPGTYTFTVPAGVTRIRVAVCGGGGGGMANTGNYNEYKYASDGGDSMFGSLISAVGGKKGSFSFKFDDEGGLSSTTVECGVGGSPNGRKGSASDRYEATGGAGFALSFSLTNGDYGKGGDANMPHMPAGWGIATVSGGSGGYNSNYVNVSAGNTYPIVVGAGGSGAANSTRYTGEPGKSGFVIIAFGGDI